MALTGKRLDELTEITIPEYDDVLYLENDPASAHNHRKVTLATLRGGIFNVMDYAGGATINDGATDASTAIQAAIDAAAAAASTTSDAAAVVIPGGGSYNLGTTGITVPAYVHLIGLGRPYLLYSGTDFAVSMAGSYAMLRDLVVNVSTASGQSDYFGAVKIGGGAAQASSNVIDHCLIQGTETGTQADPFGVGIYIAGPNTTYPTYFNEIVECKIRRWYRGTLHHDAANQQKYRGGVVEYYTLYGVDLAGSDENQMDGTFFQQAAGTGVYGLTYAVHVGAAAVLNQLSYGAEPGTYSSPLLCENSGNTVYSINANGTYGMETDGLLRLWSTAGDLVTDTIVATESLDVYDSTALGSEMVLNGDFATTPDTNWTWGSGWTLESAKAKFAGGSQNTLTQSLTITAGCAYRISVTLSGDADSGVQVVYNGTNYFRARPNATTTKYFIAAAGGSTFTITPSSNFSGSVDDVSVKRITGGTFRAQGPIYSSQGVYSGVAGIAQGHIDAAHGPGGNTPSYLKLASPNGTVRYLFVEDDGTVKVHTSAPTANTDGSVVGAQT